MVSGLAAEARFVLSVEASVVPGGSGDGGGADGAGVDCWEVLIRDESGSTWLRSREDPNATSVAALRARAGAAAPAQKEGEPVAGDSGGGGGGGPAIVLVPTDGVPLGAGDDATLLASLASRFGIKLAAGAPAPALAPAAAAGGKSAGGAASVFPSRPVKVGGSGASSTKVATRTGHKVTTVVRDNEAQAPVPAMEAAAAAQEVTGDISSTSNNDSAGASKEKSPQAAVAPSLVPPTSVPAAAAAAGAAAAAAGDGGDDGGGDGGGGSNGTSSSSSSSSSSSTGADAGDNSNSGIEGKAGAPSDGATSCADSSSSSSSSSTAGAGAGATAGAAASQQDEQKQQQTPQQQQTPEEAAAAQQQMMRTARRLADCWLEVSFLLRRKVASDEDVLEVEAALEAGASVLAEVDTLAKQLGIRRGEVVQSLLPFNSNTSASEQGSVAAEQATEAFEALQRKVAPEAFAALETSNHETFNAERHQRMVKDAVALRQLARVKLADDADLDMARQAVMEAAAFFKLLRLYAKKARKTPHACLAELE